MAPRSTQPGHSRSRRKRRKPPTGGRGAELTEHRASETKKAGPPGNPSQRSQAHGRSRRRELDGVARGLVLTEGDWDTCRGELSWQGPVASRWSGPVRRPRPSRVQHCWQSAPTGNKHKEKTKILMDQLQEAETRAEFASRRGAEWQQTVGCW